MPHYIHNSFTVTAVDCFDSQVEFPILTEDLLKSAVETWTFEGGINAAGRRHLTLEFETTWKPPVEAYKRLESWISHRGGFLELKAEATWTDEAYGHDVRFRWLFDGDKFEVMEVGLLKQDQRFAYPQECVGEILSFTDRWQNLVSFIGLPEDPFEEPYSSEKDLHEDLMHRAHNRHLKWEEERKRKECKVVSLDQYRKTCECEQELPF